MTPADQYRIKAGDLAALAKAEKDPFQKAEFERLSQGFLRLDRAPWSAAPPRSVFTVQMPATECW